MLHIQVGFGLANDVAAIQCSLGSQGQACGAVVRPAIELMLLARQLRRDFPSQIPKVRFCCPHLCNIHIVFACREMPTQTFSNKIMSEVVVAASACDCSGALSAFICVPPSRLLRDLHLLVYQSSGMLELHMLFWTGNWTWPGRASTRALWQALGQDSSMQ